MSELLGIRPWEQSLLSVEQFDRAVQYVDNHNAQMAKASDS